MSNSKAAHLSTFFCFLKPSPIFFYNKKKKENIGFSEPDRKIRPVSSWDHCPAKNFRSTCIETFITAMISKKGSHSSCVSHFRVRMDLAIDFHRTHTQRERKKKKKDDAREEGNLIPSERIGHTYKYWEKLTHWTPIRSVRKKKKNKYM